MREFGNLFGIGNSGGYDQAQDYLKQIPGYLQQYLGPYAQAGQSALGDFNPYLQAGQSALQNEMGQYGQLTSNPSQVLNKISSGYSQSPGYQFALSQALKAANQSASAGGITGTPAAQGYAEKTATGLADQDFNTYLQHALGLYGQGLSGEQGIAQSGLGATSDIFNTGARSAMDLGSSLANNLMSQSGLAYSNALNRQNELGSGIGGLLGGGLNYLFHRPPSGNVSYSSGMNQQNYDPYNWQNYNYGLGQ